MRMQLGVAGVCLVAHAAVTKLVFLTNAIQADSTDLPSPPSSDRSQKRITRRSYSTGAIERSARPADALQSLHALDARRRRQAETGQLLPRSAGKTSMDAPSWERPRIASDPSDAFSPFESFRSDDIVQEASGSATPLELARGTNHTGAPKLGREPVPKLGREPVPMLGREPVPMLRREPVPMLRREPVPMLRNGVSYFNTSTRIVNAGFEVHPAGSHDSTPIGREREAAEPDETSRTSTESKRNRLQKQWRS